MVLCIAWRLFQKILEPTNFWSKISRIATSFYFILNLFLYTSSFGMSTHKVMVVVVFVVVVVVVE